MRKITVKSVCVYCGSGKGVKPVYAEAARELGRAMAGQGIRLVYGGSSVGMMGEIANAVLEAGGEVTGIVPPNMPAHEVPLRAVQEYIEVGSLHQRKMLMFEKADAFVALPGGVGTLEELVEQITWVQLGHHGKPVVIANIDGYWEPLLHLFQQMRGQGFISPAMDIRYHVANRAEDVIPVIEQAVKTGGQKTISTMNGIELRGV